MKVTVTNIKTTARQMAKLLQDLDKTVKAFDERGVVELDSIFLIPSQEEWSVVDKEADVLDALLDDKVVKQDVEAEFKMIEEFRAEQENKTI